MTKEPDVSTKIIIMPSEYCAADEIYIVCPIAKAKDAISMAKKHGAVSIRHEGVQKPLSHSLYKHLEKVDL